jgi:hypothetical protein
MRIAVPMVIALTAAILVLSRSPAPVPPPRPSVARPPSQKEATSASLIYTIALDIESSAPERVFSELLPALIDLNPLTAAAQLEKIDSGEFRDEYILRLAQLWAARDPEAALKWASEIKSSAERYRAIRAACLELSQTNPGAAIDAIQTLNVPNDRNALENIVQSWAAQDLSAATSWALTESPPDSRDTLLTRISFVLSQSDPREAANFIVKNLPPGAIQTEAAISVLHNWAIKDWNSAKQWVDQFPEGPLRERAQTEITGVKDYLAATRTPQ